MPPGRTCKQAGELGRPHESRSYGLRQRTLELPARHGLGEIEEGASWACKGEPVAFDHVSGLETCGPMQANTRVTPVVADDRDVDLFACDGTKPPQLGRRLMAEHGPFRACEHGGCLGCERRRHRMAHQIHATMHTV